MPDNPAPVRKYCSLQEALEIVGKRAFPSEWTGHEADLSPAKDFATLRRCVRSTRALLALLHDGRVTAWFIFDGSTLEEQRREIIPSEWPNPANFLARLPFGDLWFDLVSSRGALRPKPEDRPVWYQRFANTPLWHAYSPLVGRIELDQEALRLAGGDGTGQASDPAPTGPCKPQRRHDPLEDAALKVRIEAVLAKARTEWPKKNKRPGIKPMAKHLATKHGKKLGFGYEAIRKILRGTYPASKRLGISGL